MFRFWGLLGLAFLDLVVAGALVGRGERNTALVFLGLAVVSAAIALLWSPSPRRDPRGRLQPAELPYGKVIGLVGAAAILGGAAYVATYTSRPAPPPPPLLRPAPRAQPAAPASTAPQPIPRAPATASSGLLYKCVGPDGVPSYQSQPCAPDSRREWVRDATPEPPPTAAQRAAQRRRALEQRHSERAAAARAGGGWAPASSSRDDGRRAACDAARAADAAYRRQPLKYVTHDGLRRHGDAVREACG